MEYDSEEPAPGGPELSSAHGRHGARCTNDAFRCGCFNGSFQFNWGEGKPQRDFQYNGCDASK